MDVHVHQIVNAPALKTTNGFGSEIVKTVKSVESVRGGKALYRFPAHSFTQIKATLA